jgi:hypothetical protein
MLTSTTRAFINEQQYGGKKKMKDKKAAKKPMKKMAKPKKQGY